MRFRLPRRAVLQPKQNQQKVGRIKQCRQLLCQRGLWRISRAGNHRAKDALDTGADTRHAVAQHGHLRVRSQTCREQSTHRQPVQRQPPQIGFNRLHKPLSQRPRRQRRHFLF